MGKFVLLVEQACLIQQSIIQKTPSSRGQKPPPQWLRRRSLPAENTDLVND